MHKGLKGPIANEPCLRRLKLAVMKVSINDGSDWKPFSVLLKQPSQRLKKKNMYGRSFPLSGLVIPRMQCGQIPARC